MRELIRSLISAVERGTPLVYTALVETRGSTPQKAGAAMLVFPDGSQAGTLGGGCVEAEVKRRALALLAEGERSLLTFQLDHDYGWDDGLICGGRMEMLIDPVRPDEGEGEGEGDDYFRRMFEMLQTGRGGTEAVVMRPQPDGLPVGARLLYDARGDLLAARGATGPNAGVAEHLRPLSERPRPYVTGGVSYLPQLPRCRLLIVGGGHVGCKVAELAAEVDFDVWVLDDREEYCRRDRFPRAERLLCGPIDETLGQVETDGETFVIIVTRGHNHDETALRGLIAAPTRYLGMIGSKRKIRLIFDNLRRDGVSEERLSRVHAPIGLDLGSQTVPEIAVSIVAELIACRNRGGAETTAQAPRAAADCSPA